MATRCWTAQQNLFQAPKKFLSTTNSSFVRNNKVDHKFQKLIIRVDNHNCYSKNVFKRKWEKFVTTSTVTRLGVL